jgi:hypothetical protein
MARYRNDPNYDFWKMLKVGYDNFEITKVPPKVDVCEKRYVFNQVAANGEAFNPAGPCPATTQPDGLKVAYGEYQSKYEAAFNAAIGSGENPAPKASILGTKEAKIVADWSKRRARGERVTIEPPSLNADGSVTETNRMGRIDSPLGRKMAALDAEKAAKQKAEEEKAAAIAAAKAAKEAEKAQKLAEKEAEKQRLADAKAAKAGGSAQTGDAAVAVQAAPADAPPEAVTQTASDEGGVMSKMSRMKKRLFGMFGG